MECVSQLEAAGQGSFGNKRAFLARFFDGSTQLRVNLYTMIDYCEGKLQRLKLRDVTLGALVRPEVGWLDGMGESHL